MKMGYFSLIISSATASFDFSSIGTYFKFLSMKVTLLVSFLKPAPSSRDFKTIKSKFSEF
jgi:hypothetical protein